MKKVVILLLLICLFATNVSATELFSAPTAPSEAQTHMPSHQTTFSEDLWHILKSAFREFFPNLTDAVGICLSVIALTLLVAIIKDLNSISTRTVELVGVVSIGTLLMSSSNSLISLASRTVESISEYGKLLLPVMTAALAAEGGTTTSATLYTGTIVFNTGLTTLITKFIIPLLYIYLATGITCTATTATLLSNFKDFIKWLMTWTLKIAIYVFTGYLGITKVVSGSADAAAIKAAKIAISGSVPVIGSIISDASEAVLVSVGIMKNAAGIYGVLAIVSICIVPFITIGAQYLLLKITAGVCGLLGGKRLSEVTHDFSYAMGILLATTGAICIILMISTVCFMRGVS